MAPNNSEAKDGQMDAATTRGIPQLKNIEQVSEGWINKYILTYELPDGTDYVYEQEAQSVPYGPFGERPRRGATR